METATTEYRIGHLRLKYLDLANISFAQREYTNAEGQVKNFMSTIDANSPEGKQIKEEFDKVVQMKRESIRALKQQAEGLSYLAKKDINDAIDELEIHALHDKKNICWSVSMQKGLFYE